MSKVRVYEVARDLGINAKELVSLLQSLGVSEVRNHMSAVGQDAVERVKRKLERKADDSGNVVEERIAPGVVKRQSRGAPARIVSSPGLRAPAAPVSAPSRRADEPPPSGRVSRPAPSRPAPSRPAPSQPGRGDGARERPSREHDEPVDSTPAPMTTPTPTLEAPRPERAPIQPPPEPRAAEPAPAAPSQRGAARRAEPPPPILDEEAPESASPLPSMTLPSEEQPTPPPPPPTIQSPPPRTSGRPAGSTPAPTAAASTAPAEGDAKRRPTSPPKTGIEVWEGWNPQQRTGRTGPPSTQRRKTYDPRANTGPQPRHGGFRGGTNLRGPGFRPRPGFGGRNQRRGPTEVSTKEMSDRKKVVKIEGETSLQTLAANMSLKATDVLMKLLSMGVTGVNINSTLDADTAKLLAAEFGWTVEDVAINVEEELAAATEMDEEGDVGEATGRPPIVTVMGHVDHGKTTLLDTIRKAQVAAGEAGGITQHIGAYRVETKRGTVCFLDTPGHEAFTSMRARGASVTDLVILCVAADDGVMPQTREAISHARDAGVPIIVAVNKIDKPGVDTDRVMRELAQEGLNPEDWGGETIFVKVSGLTGQGVDQLLEMVLLQSEMLELKAYPQKRASGVVVEALLDRGRGAVARVLVQDGTLRRGDILLAGHAYGKIRAMVDEKGRMLKEATASTPVEVLGLNEVPDAGDPVHAVKSLRIAETLADERKKKLKIGRTRDAGIRLDELAQRLAEADMLELKVIIKGDVQGSVEALQQALEKLSTKKVKLTVVHTGVGGISESDVNLAAAGGAIIIGFNVRPAGKARKHAEQEGVEIRLYSVIYECIDDVRGAMEGLLPARQVEKELGKAEVRQIFRISRVGTIAGCMVQSGLIRRSAEARLVRDSVVVWSGKLASLKRFKDDAREVREGTECGISLDGFNDLKEGDIIEAFEFEQVKATLE
jgi:translation initiation factor IF-2